MKNQNKNSLIEQVIDWNTLEQEVKDERSKAPVIVTPKPKPNTPPIVNTNTKDAWGRKSNDPFFNFDPKTNKFVAGSCKGLTKAQCDAKNKPKPETGNDANNIAKHQSKLISNAVLFYERISVDANRGNWDEDKLKKLFKDFIFVPRAYPDPAMQAAYVDMLYKILFKMQNLTNKYPKQYQYWVSRNYAVGATLDSLRSMKLNSAPTFLSWFRGKTFDYMDWTITEMNWSFDLVFKQPINVKQLYDDPQSSNLTLQKSFSIDQIHKKVMDAYNNKIWGEPEGKRKNVVFPK
jgi:hypothetical protein